MNEPDIIGDITAIFLGVLLCGVAFFILFLPQIDRFVQKLRKKRAA